MKSYIVPNIKDLNSVFSPPITQEERVLKKIYENKMMNEFKYYENTEGFPFSNILNSKENLQQNILENSNTKSIKYFFGGNRNTTGFYNMYFSPNGFVSTSPSYNSLIIQFNKSHKDTKEYFKALKNLSNTSTISYPRIIFFDNTSTTDIKNKDGNSILNTVRLLETTIILSKFKHINFEDCYIMLSPEDFKEFPFPSGSFPGKCYHYNFELILPRMATLRGSVPNPSDFSDFSILEIGNIIATTAIEVEFSNETSLEIENLSEKVESKEGIIFKDIRNTRKKLKLKLMMLNTEEYLNLFYQFIQESLNNNFFIISQKQENLGGQTPFSAFSKDYLNNEEDKFLYSGLYIFENTPKSQRSQLDFYDIEFELIEVI